MGRPKSEEPSTSSWELLRSFDVMRVHYLRLEMEAVRHHINQHYPGSFWARRIGAAGSFFPRDPDLGAMLAVYCRRHGVVFDFVVPQEPAEDVEARLRQPLVMSEQEEDDFIREMEIQRFLEDGWVQRIELDEMFESAKRSHR